MKRLLTLTFGLIACIAQAGPESYQLDAARSEVTFSYTFDRSTVTGRMPVKSADLLLDLENLSASRVLVTMNADAARAGFIFATEAMKSRKVLDTAQFPDIHFRSTNIDGDLRGADVAGDLTIRGVTRPMILQARLFRQRGTAVDDRNNLLVELVGTTSRSAFGASGYPNLVGDVIHLRIIAMITR